jgi:electron transport complex protein RnfD
LILPDTINPMIAALGAIFAMAIVKHCFGGLGSNWLNPALGGWLFIVLAFPQAYVNALGVSLVPGMMVPTVASVTSFLNSHIFGHLGAEIPQAIVSQIFYTGNGIIADRGLLGLLLGTIILCVFHSSKMEVSIPFMLLYLGLATFGNGSGSADGLESLFSGGVLVVGFLLLADPSSSPKTRSGAIVEGILAALFACLFRKYGAQTYGAIYAAALMNALCPLFRSIENLLMYRRVLC